MILVSSKYLEIKKNTEGFPNKVFFLYSSHEDMVGCCKNNHDLISSKLRRAYH